MNNPYQETAPFLAEAACKQILCCIAWKAYPLVEVQSLTHNTNRFRFQFPNPNMEMGLEVSSLIVTKAKGLKGEDGKVREKILIFSHVILGHNDKAP